jgi:hypothetical protein
VTAVALGIKEDVHMKGLSIMKSLMLLAVLLLLPWQSIQAIDMKSEKPPIEQPLVR